LKAAAEPSFLQKIRDRQLAKPTDSSTLQDLVENELAEKAKTASDGLLWLNRFVSPRLSALLQLS
jgi:hypothetical protein